jgi:phosphoribosylanthranilate isomerase
MLKIKVCGITDPVNAGMISELNVDYMGFIFYPGSKRYVGESPDESLFRSIPKHIIKTGVFVDEELPLLIDHALRYQLDLIQLHGNETPDYCRSVYSNGLKIIKAFRVGYDFDFRITDEYLDYCDFFLFDTDTGHGGGSGIKFDWRKLDEYHSGKPFFLSGGICPGDAESILRLGHRDLFAVDINSCFEIRPGFKDVDKVNSFIKDIKS